ncbi:MAG: FAD-dependent oxidoreductase [Deltaproteobacteria bacterium]|nr:FAD-dependent oxidoreductase [Deltaproteobacteria bacterium]
MISATLVMVGVAGVCGVILSFAARVFHVEQDPRIEEVEGCLAGANCGGCGFAGCAAAAAAIVEGRAKPNACVVGGPETAAKVSEILGVVAGTAEVPSAENPCAGGHRAQVKYLYEGVKSCRAQFLLYGGQRLCDIGCLGEGDCVRACLFGAIRMGPDGYPVVDKNRCVGCGACARACPKGILEVRTLCERLLHFNREDECLAPCRQTCPAEINIPLYIAQIRGGDYEGAVNTIRERNPLLLSCGRVCPHPCETNCRRAIEDEPVSINQLKRFAADYEMNSGKRFPVPVAPPTNHRVAVVGGGPAGLSCAFFLKRLGHEITIFESMPKLGGMLRYGIPEYRLPKKVLEWEIDGIIDLGIKVRTNVVFGLDLDLTSLVAAGFDAVFLGIGAWKDSILGVAGEDSKGCYKGIDFLSGITSGKMVPLGRTAIVVGGGNTAVDCVRTLIRLGVEKVTILYRRTRSEMPANEVEIEAAEREGADFVFLAAPVSVKVDAQGKVTHLEYLKMELGEPDKSGRRRPVPVEGSETLLETDMIVTAIGQSPDFSFTGRTQSRLAQLKTTRWSTVDVDPNTLQSNIPYVFAAGDAATGPSLVVEAIGGGRRAARSIHQFLTGEEVANEPGELGKKLIPETIFEQVKGIERKPRSKMVELPVHERVHSFVEVDQVLTEEEALTESRRCLFCGRICYTQESPISLPEEEGILKTGT